MQKDFKMSEWEYEAVREALQEILGYCGTWSTEDIIEVRQDTGHAVSMCVDTFLEELRRRFGLK